jgi:hypothetical protein
VTEQVGEATQDWRLRVRVGLESKVAYPTPQEWNDFDAQTAERLRKNQIADEAVEVAEKARREEQQQQELRRKAKEEPRVPEKSRREVRREEVKKTLEESERLSKEFLEAMEALKVIGETQNDRKRRQDTPQDTVGGESVPPKQENEEKRQVVREPEVRRSRRVRI